LSAPLCLDHIHELGVESNLRPWRFDGRFISVLGLGKFLSLVYLTFSESFFYFKVVLSKLGFYFSVLRVMVLFFWEKSFRLLKTVFCFAFFSTHVLLLYRSLRHCLGFVHIFNLRSFKVWFLLLNESLLSINCIGSSSFALMGG